MNLRALGLFSLVFFVLLFLVRSSLGQTNTFPGSGNAGVGTLNPLLPLHLDAAQDGNLLPLLLLRNAGSSANSAVSMDFLNYSGAQPSGKIGARIQALRTTADSKHALIFSTASGSWVLNEHMRITDFGYVGVGTNTPTTLLHLKSTIDAELTIAAGVDKRANLKLLNDAQQFDVRVRSSDLFSIEDVTNGTAPVVIEPNAGFNLLYLKSGSVGIGTSTPDPNYKLSVNGKIRAKEVVVETGWSDFVFGENYALRPLAEVEQFVKANKHLPEIPSAQEVTEKGVSVGEMQSKLLQKIEELTLYVIDLKKENERLQKRVAKLEEAPE